MGTRSLTHFKETRDSAPFCTVYRQFDGYFDGHGLDLSNCVPHTLGNGISERVSSFANRMDGLAIQTIANLQTAAGDGFDENGAALPGNLYMMKPGASDCGEEYVYELFPENDETGTGATMLRVYDGGFGMFGESVEPVKPDPVYDGKLADFEAWLAAYNVENDD